MKSNRLPKGSRDMRKMNKRQREREFARRISLPASGAQHDNAFNDWFTNYRKG